MRKRIIALVLSIVMILGVIPFSAFADEAATTPNEIYLFDVPESGSVQHSNISSAVGSKYVQEDGENFVHYVKKDGKGAGAMNGCNAQLKNIATTYGSGATGLPEDSGINDFDLSKAYIAIRLKHKDNSPAFTYSNTSLDIRMAMDGTTNRITLTSADYSYYWVDKKDGSKIKYTGGSTNTYCINFAGDNDGWFLFPLSNTSLITLDRLKKSLSTMDIYFRGGSSATQKYATWDDKELLVGDISLVQDIDKFLSEKCPNFANDKKYAPNNAEDSAYYGVKIGLETVQRVRYNGPMLSKTINNPTIGNKTSNHPYNHVVILPNGDKALEFSYAEKYVSKATYIEGDATTDYAHVTAATTHAANLTAADTYDDGKNLGSSGDRIAKGGSKVPADILNNSDYIALRVATKGVAESSGTKVLMPVINLSNLQNTGNQNYSAYHFFMTVSGSYTYIDANTGAREELLFNNAFSSVGNSKGHTLRKDLDGYIIFPRSAFYNAELKKTLAEDSYTIYQYHTSGTSGTYTFAQLWGGAYYRSSGFIGAVSYAIRRDRNSNNYWDPAIKLYAGDVLFVSDKEKFVDYHTSCDIFGHDYQITDSKVPTDDEDGYITYTCQREGCGDTYTDVISCLHENVEKRNIVAATCTEKGYTGDLYCTKCQMMLEEGTETEPLGHKEIAGEGKEPTCTEHGYESSIVCERCKEFLREVNEIPAIPHKYEGEGTVVAPTENESGYTKYTCDYGCGAIHKGNYVMPLSSEVKNVKAEQIRQTMNLEVTWDAIEGADMYLVYVYDAEGKQIRGATVTNGNTFVKIDGFEVGNYTVKVRARVGGKYTSKYDAVEVAFGSIIPKPVVTHTTADGFTVVWSGLNNAQGYYVAFENETERYSFNTTKTFITVNNLKADTEYKISVCVKFSDAVFTPFGEQITARTSKHADIYLNAKYAEEGVLVSWDILNAHEDSADQFWVYRVDENGNWNLFAAPTETSVLTKDIDGQNKFGIIARVKDKHGIYRYVQSEVVEVPKKPETNLILNSDGSFGGSLNKELYGEGAPKNGEYNVENSDYYTVNNDYYNMSSNEERVVIPNFASYQQTMANSDGLACLLMVLNYMGQDVKNEYSELELVKKYEAMMGESVLENGTPDEKLAEFINGLGLGYTAKAKDFGNYKITGDNYGTAAGTSREATKEFLKNSIKEGKFVFVRYQSAVGFKWKIVIGYDEFGLCEDHQNPGQYKQYLDDIMIFADPYDGSDHLQDGYVVERILDFHGWWCKMTMDGKVSDKLSCVVVDPNLDIEFDYQPVDYTVKQTLYELHMPRNPDGTYGGMARDPKVYKANIGNGTIDHPHANYLKVNDFYNMGSEGSRVLLKNYGMFQQTCGSTCLLCSTTSVLTYYGHPDSSFDLELNLLNHFEDVTGMDIKNIGTTVNHLPRVLKPWGYTAEYNLNNAGSPKFKTYEEYMAFMRENLEAGRPIVVTNFLGSDHAMTVIGLDDMGTPDYIYDDVIINADSHDWTDGYQDGYATRSAYKFFSQHTNPRRDHVQEYLIIYR